MRSTVYVCIQVCVSVHSVSKYKMTDRWITAKSKKRKEKKKSGQRQQHAPPRLNSHNPLLFFCFTPFLLTFSSTSLLTSILFLVPLHLQCSAHLPLSKTRPPRKFTTSPLLSPFTRINSTFTALPPELPRNLTHIHTHTYIYFLILPLAVILLSKQEPS